MPSMSRYGKKAARFGPWLNEFLEDKSMMTAVGYTPTPHQQQKNEFIFYFPLNYEMAKDRLKQ